MRLKSTTIFHSRLIRLFLVLLAGQAVILVLLNQPAHVRGILDEWSVAEALPFLPLSVPEDYFAIYLALLRYLGLGLCWLAGTLILSQKIQRPTTFITAAALWFAPLTFGLAGDLATIASPAPWGGLLKVMAGFLSILGMICFLLTLHIFPDGRFHPGWLKYVIYLSVVLVAGGFGVSSNQNMNFPEWGWYVFLFSLGAVLLSSTASQAVRLWGEKRAVQRWQHLPFFLISLTLLLWIAFSFSGLISPSAWVAFLNLHILIGISAVFSLTVLTVSRHNPSWETGWSPQLVLLSAALPGMLALLGWWVAAPILRQSQFIASREVVVSGIPAEPKIPLIFDTDLAADDYLALLYLLQHPAVELQAVTIAGTGEAHCEPGVRNVLKVLNYLGAGEIPVSCGSEKPLSGDHEFPAAWRASVDNFFGIELPASQRQASPLAAPELIAEILSSSSEPVSILAVGPLTNLGELFLTHPDLSARIARIYVMGGAVRAGGNVYLEDMQTSYAEWNIYIDPYAANLVLQSGTPVTLVPLDATNYVPVEHAFKRRLAKAAVTPAARLASQLLAALSPAAGPYHFWDTLAAAIVTDPGVAYFQNAPLRVVEEEGPYAGQTAWTSSGTPTRYASGASQPNFEGLLLAVLNQP